jgi:hypothetical protein
MYTIIAETSVFEIEQQSGRKMEAAGFKSWGWGNFQGLALDQETADAMAATASSLGMEIVEVHFGDTFRWGGKRQARKDAINKAMPWVAFATGPVVIGATTPHWPVAGVLGTLAVLSLTASARILILAYLTWQAKDLAALRAAQTREMWRKRITGGLCLNDRWEGGNGRACIRTECAGCRVDGGEITPLQGRRLADLDREVPVSLLMKLSRQEQDAVLVADAQHTAEEKGADNEPIPEPPDRSGTDFPYWPGCADCMGGMHDPAIHYSPRHCD